MVSTAGKTANQNTGTCVSQGEFVKSAGKARRKTLLVQDASSDYMRSIRSRLRHSGFSQQAPSMICSSWRRGTQKQYASYIAKWKRYASKKQIHSVSPSVNEAINFLAVLYKAGLSYSAICVARSALSSYLDCSDCDVFGEHRLVKRFIKGVFELRPALPKYSATWDVDIILEYFRDLLSS